MDAVVGVQIFAEWHTDDRPFILIVDRNTNTFGRLKGDGTNIDVRTKFVAAQDFCSDATKLFVAMRRH